MSEQVHLDASNTLCLQGKIDLYNVKSICLAGNNLIDSLATIRIDLSAVEHSDSSVLALLVEWVRRAQKQHKDIVFVSIPQPVLDLGRVCGLDTVLPIENPLKWQ